jgi:hypothetical protein
LRPRGAHRAVWTQKMVRRFSRPSSFGPKDALSRDFPCAFFPGAIGLRSRPIFRSFRRVPTRGRARVITSGRGSSDLEALGAAGRRVERRPVRHVAAPTSPLSVQPRQSGLTPHRWRRVPLTRRVAPSSASAALDPAPL